MKVAFAFRGYHLEITTDHAASSHGQPVVLSDGRLTDAAVDYVPDDEQPTALDLLADAAGIWAGPQTRRELAAVAETMLSETDAPRGADYDRVIDAFAAEGRRRQQAAE